MVFHANRNQKKVGVAVFTSDKIDFKNKDCYKRKRRTVHYDQWIDPRKDITIVNIYAPQK